ncbi:MAG: hypothetical protein P8P71_08925, partial [Phycisphaerales bacterium]|nr:hypothetical protein [Phycisphaerales bacterium]
MKQPHEDLVVLVVREHGVESTAMIIEQSERLHSDDRETRKQSAGVREIPVEFDLRRNGPGGGLNLPGFARGCLIPVSKRRTREHGVRMRSERLVHDREEVRSRKVVVIEKPDGFDVRSAAKGCSTHVPWTARRTGVLGKHNHIAVQAMFDDEFFKLGIRSVDDDDDRYRWKR